MTFFVIKLKVPKSKGIIIICLLAALQGVARIIIPIMLSTGSGPVLETPVSDQVMAFINGMFLAIGGLGLLTTFGLWTGRRWGYIGTIALSLLTIVFDVWAVMAVQWSAAMGLVLPVVFIAYLALFHRDFPRGEAR